MHLPARSRLVPQCTECLRSYAFGYLTEIRSALGGIEHVRGKKKKSTRGPLTMPVRLRKDMQTYGPKGAIVPVAIGFMRNSWFPSRIADYVPAAELRALKKSETRIERNYNYSIKVEDPVETEEGAEPIRPAAVEVKTITPERGIALLDIFVPQTLDFYRQVIMETEPEPEPEPESEPAKGMTGAAAELLEMQSARKEAARVAEKERRRNAPQPIYGSVSTHDVLLAVKAAMADNDEASRVIVQEEDIQFIRSALENTDITKLKHLGTYGFSIKLKGSDSILRNVRIIAENV